MTAAAKNERLLTAEEYASEPDDPRTELVRGRIVEFRWPEAIHGLVHASVSSQLAGFVKECNLGTAVIGVGIITTHNPDTVRGADVSFYSHERIPKGKMPRGWPEKAPECVFEIRSRDDCAAGLLERAGEYFHVGTLCVAVIDPRQRNVVTFSDEDFATIFREDDRLSLPEPLSGWRPRVSDFFREELLPCTATSKTTSNNNSMKSRPADSINPNES